jgi:hypothetical protein
MKTAVLIALSFLAQASAFADDLPSYVKECQVVATETFKEEATGQKLTLQEETIRVDSIDDRWYNPDKYVWFKADAVSESGQVFVLQTMTQKQVFPSKPCF